LKRKKLSWQKIKPRLEGNPGEALDQGSAESAVRDSGFEVRMTAGPLGWGCCKGGREKKVFAFTLNREYSAKEDSSGHFQSEFGRVKYRQAKKKLLKKSDWKGESTE